MSSVCHTTVTYFEQNWLLNWLISAAAALLLGFVLLMHLEHILIILHTVPKPHLDESLDF